MSNNKNNTPFQLPSEPIVPTVRMPQQQQLSIEQVLKLAAQHQQEGRLQDAEILLKQILQVQPNNSQALHTLGIVAHMAGKTPLGIQLIEQAIKNDNKTALFYTNAGEMHRMMKNLPVAIRYGEKAVKLDKNLAAAHANLGIAYYDNKEFNKAEFCQKRALKLNPDFVAALNNMGSIMRERKDKEGAVDYYRKALKVNPNYTEGMNNIGATLVQLDCQEEALLHLNKALLMNPNYADAHCNKGFALQSLDQEGSALTSFYTALQLRPQYAEAYIGLARVYHEQHDMDKAEEAINKAIAIDSQMAEAYSVLGAIYMSQGNTDKAEEAYKQALALDKEITSAKMGQGNIYLEKGQFEEAEELFRTALEERSEKVGALFSLAQVKKVKDGDSIIELMEAENKNIGKMPPHKALYVHFGLGKIYDDLKQPEKAFPHFIEGCRLKRQKLEYSIEQKQKEFDVTKEIFTKEFIDARRGHGDKSEVPIFVLGMPRSGTTLTEQIIASHPDAYGAGELMDLLNVAHWKGKAGELTFPWNMRDLTTNRLNEMGKEYVQGLVERSPESKRITDKMPANFFHVGLIHLMLPNAKIVHVQRHPLDTCISCFTRLFSHNQNNTYDMAELGHFYKCYKDLMAHWKKVLPEGSFYNVRYEDVVEDTEGQAKALINYCGLDWDEACLEFYKHKRSVRTASVTQVRQPIYNSSVARWKKYDKFIGPLKEALGEALEGENI